MDLIDSNRTHVSGIRSTSMNPTSTTCRIRWPILMRGLRMALTWISANSPAAMTLVPRPEYPEEPGHDDQHGARANPADRGGIALEPITDLERFIPHVDGPGIRGQCAVEAAQDQVFVDDGHRGSETQHHQHQQNWTQPGQGNVPE